MAAGRKVDKHSTGGVGDKVTICLAPLVAACGVPAPMLVGRALGHTGGTLDKLAAIPGFQAQLTPAAFRRVLARARLRRSPGRAPRLVPADGRLYALRDATATVESIPLIASSILSKKIAGGADALVLDVKVGRGAFLPRPRDTHALARTLVALGKRLGLPTVALLTAMDQPLGRAVGNANELAEALEILRGQGPADTRALTVRLGAEMLLAGRRGGRTARKPPRGSRRPSRSGAGFERLLRAVTLQGGDASVLEHPERLAARPPPARGAGAAGRLGRRAWMPARSDWRPPSWGPAGCARRTPWIPAVGITLHAKEGDPVTRGEPLFTLWYNDRARLDRALVHLGTAFVLGGQRHRSPPLVRGYYA